MRAREDEGRCGRRRRRAWGEESAEGWDGRPRGEGGYGKARGGGEVDEGGGGKIGSSSLRDCVLS